MDILCILGHPRAESFCRAITDTAVATLRTNRHRVTFHDLYAEGFDPLITAEEVITRVSKNSLVEQHCAELAGADGLVVVHPNWWGQPPAIVKGWIDRVIRPGIAYDYVVGLDGTRKLVKKLHVQTVLVFNTSEGPQKSTDSQNTLKTLWQRCILGLCGIPQVKQILFSGMRASSPQMRATWLEKVRTVVSAVFQG